MLREITRSRPDPRRSEQAKREARAREQQRRFKQHTQTIMSYVPPRGPVRGRA